MNRAPKTVQQKQHQRANLRSESKNRSFNKEGFSTHGERNSNINVRQQNETSMFDREAVHTVRERSNNSGRKGKPGKPGKPQLPFFGMRRFSVESPQNYTAVSSLLDKATFHLYTIREMTWLFNVIFSKYLRIHKLEKRKPIVPPFDIEKAFLNLHRNKFDFFALEAELDFPAVASRDNITEIRIMAAFTKHRPDSVVDCLKRYMTYQELKDMRILSASLKADTYLMSKYETAIPVGFEEYPDSFWGLQSVDAHFVQSSLNGNNGSWTGLDDVECAECIDRDDCTKCCHHHLQRSGRRKGEAKPPSSGAKRRVEEVKKMMLCGDVCPGLDSHYHPADTFCLTCSPTQSDDYFTLVENEHGLFEQTPILPKLNRKDRRNLKKDVERKSKQELNSDLFSAFCEDNYVSNFIPASNIQIGTNNDRDRSSDNASLVGDSYSQIDTDNDRDRSPDNASLISDSCIPTDVLSLSSMNLPDIGDIYDMDSRFADQVPTDFRTPAISNIIRSNSFDSVLQQLDDFLNDSHHSVVSNLTQPDPSDLSVIDALSRDDHSSILTTPFLSSSVSDQEITPVSVILPSTDHVNIIKPDAGPAIVAEQSPLKTERFYLAGDVNDDSILGYLTKGTFLEGMFSGVSVIGQQTQVTTSATHIFGLITCDSTHNEYSWRDLGFTKYKDLEIHPELAQHITRYAIENRLVRIETSSTGKRTFGFKEHAESAIREYLALDHFELNKKVKDKWVLNHSYTIAWGLQQAMRPTLLLNDVQTSKFPVVNKMGNDRSRPTSSIGKQAVKG